MVKLPNEKQACALIDKLGAIVSMLPADQVENLLSMDNSDLLQRLTNGMPIESPVVARSDKPSHQANIDIRDKVIELKLGDRIYELICFVKDNEEKEGVSAETMFKRSEELGADSGDEDGRWFLSHGYDIPQEMCGKIFMVFPCWRGPKLPNSVGCVDWRIFQWIQCTYLIDRKWHKNARIVRRVK